MLQHAAAKQAHPDCVVFFRLGDFYEMFGDDAVLVAEVLGLTLTSRNKGKPDEIPMAGVPHHAAHGYIARLLEAGHKVAICEQMADPATVRGIVPREVVRVITPGTWTSEEQLEDKRNNWLCAIAPSETGVGVALLDLSTAELCAAELRDWVELLSEVGRAEPREILILQDGAAPGDESEGRPETLRSCSETAAGLPDALTALREVAPRARCGSVPPLAPNQALELLRGVDWGETSPLALAAAAAALGYARDCQKGAFPPVFRVARLSPSSVLAVDRTAARHLELVEPASDDPTATLLWTIDRTRTPSGARLLRRRLLSPLTDIEQIRRRQDEVQVLIDNGAARSELREALSLVGDLERIAVRSSRGESSPRDLGQLRRGLAAAARALDIVSRLPDAESRAALLGPVVPDVVPELRARLEASLVERPPSQVKDGNVFLAGYDASLDELAELCTSGSRRIAQFEEALREQTGIGGLRVRFTRVFGWYVEVGRSAAKRVPDSFRRKQTVATGERYTLDELDQLAIQIQSAEERYRIREKELLDALYAEATAASQRIHLLSARLSALDVAQSMASIAVDFDYTRPLVERSERLEVVDGRHPVVERRAALGSFVPNDVVLDAGGEHLWIISGPNMAGKSTFLRQVALIVILAQMGSFVPASSARVGICDRVLSRVGASDNLAAGESTFMVEMRETAEILRCATRRSLVILDEVGRGTSTYDGLSIAWAVAEHLDQVIGCRALFATHYHELGELAERSPTAGNRCVSAREHQGQVVFLHRVTAGVAPRSYGIEVARLAGLPEIVLARARGLLARFEGDSLGEKPRLDMAGPQLDLFRPPSKGLHDPEIVASLRAIDPDRISGLEALQLLHQLKKLADGDDD